MKVNMIKRFVEFNRRLSRQLEQRYSGIFNRPSHKDELLSRIYSDIRQLKPKSILEIGGIDRPLLKKSEDYRYIGLDVEANANCSLVYDEFVVQSIEDPVPEKADMVISTTLLEHVPDNRAAIQNISESLNNGGTTHHYIPSKWHPYSVALRIVGNRIQRILIPVIRPNSVATTGYPAFFDNCSPRSMENLFIESNLSNIEILPYYKAHHYFAFFLPAYLVVAIFENICVYFGIRTLCSGFIISASKKK
jgi:SAM-dependent methyltransferase